MHYQNQIITVSHNGVNSMSIKGLLFRFFLSYSMLLVIAAAVLSYFDGKSGITVNSGILAGVVCWVCISFGQKNRRYFTKNEKIAAVAGIIAIDLFLELVLYIAAVSGSNSAFQFWQLVFALFCIGILHTLVVYCFVDLSKKLLVRKNMIIS